MTNVATMYLVKTIYLDANALWEVVVLFTRRLHQAESQLNLFFVLGASELVAVSAGVNARSLIVKFKSGLFINDVTSILY